MNSNLKKIVMTALFAALACVATMSIKIPTPGTGGYIHPGDAIVILSGVILGPVWGLLAAGTGSAMAGILSMFRLHLQSKGSSHLLQEFYIRRLEKAPEADLPQ